MASPLYPPSSTPLSESVPVTAAIVPPIATPSHGTAGQWSVLSKTRINSSKSTPLDALNLIRDTKTWKEWNTFTPAATFTSSNLSSNEKDGILELGSNFSLAVYMDGDGLKEGGKKSLMQPEKLTTLEEIASGGFVGVSGAGKKGWRISWKANSFPGFVLWAERTLELVEIEGGGGFEFNSWETFGGSLAPLVKLLKGAQLVDRFGDYARDLKNHFEKEAAST